MAINDRPSDSLGFSYIDQLQYNSAGIPPLRNFTAYRLRGEVGEGKRAFVLIHTGYDRTGNWTRDGANIGGQTNPDGYVGTSADVIGTKITWVPTNAGGYVIPPMVVPIVLPAPVPSTPLANTYYNNSPDTLAFRNMLSGVLAGTSRTFVMEGDSTTAGVGAGTSGIIGAYANTYASKLATELVAAGYNANNDAIFGSQFVSGTATPYSQYNPKLQLTGAWVVNTALVPGYQPWTVGAAGAKFTGAWGSRIYNAVDVYYIQFASNGTVNASVDGGATIQNIDMSGTSGPVRKVTVPVPRGAHASFDLTTTSTSPVYIIGIVPRDTTVGEINIIQWGFSGALTASQATTTNQYSPSNAAMLALVAADMVIFQSTINDARTANNTPDATYKANLNTITAAWITSGARIMLMSGIPSSLADTTLAKRNSIKQQVADVASEKSLVYIDFDARCVSYDALTAKGWTAGDGLHGNIPCYADEAQWLGQIIRNM